MPILRVDKNGDFTILPNAIADRTDMSLKAKGLMWYLLSKPDDWSFSFAAIVKYCGKDGKDAVRSAVSELVDLGYLEIGDGNRAEGKFTSGVWVVHEVADTSNRVGKTAAGKPQRENRSGKPATTNTKGTNTEEPIDICNSEQAENPPTKRFVKPTASEVSEYASSIGRYIDAEAFIDFYESKGWMVGKNHMKDWKAAVRNWTRNSRTTQKPADSSQYGQYSFRRKAASC